MKRKKSGDSPSKRLKVNGSDDSDDQEDSSGATVSDGGGAESPSQETYDAKIQMLMEGIECKCHICGESLAFTKLKEHLQTHISGKKNSSVAGSSSNVECTNSTAASSGPSEDQACNSNASRDDSAQGTSKNAEPSLNKNEDQPTKCDVCGRRFQNQEKLSDHMRMHDNLTSVSSPEEGQSVCSPEEDPTSSPEGSESVASPEEGPASSPKEGQSVSSRKEDQSVSEEITFTVEVPEVEEMQKCEICGRRFKHAEKLREHMKLHSDFDAANEQQSQVDSYSPKKNCVISDPIPDHKNCSAPEETISVTKGTDVDVLHKCQICGKRFKQLDKFDKHMKMHSDWMTDDSSPVKNSVTDEKSTAKMSKVPEVLQCEICGRRFKCADKLNEHLNVHSGEMMADSDEVETGVVSSKEKSSTEARKVEEMLKCQICGRRFKKSEKLREHLQMHSDIMAADFNEEETSSVSDKPTSGSKKRCIEEVDTSQVCDEEADSDDTVIASDDEMPKTKAAKVEATKCQICGKRFELSHKLTEHLKMHSDASVSSDAVDAKQTTVEELPGEPLSAKKFACKVCGKRFRYSSLVAKHARVHSEEAGMSSFKTKSAPREGKTDHGESCVSSNVVSGDAESDSSRSVSPAAVKETSSKLKDARKLTCEVCGKKFKYSKSFEKHVMMHSDQRKATHSKVRDATEEVKSDSTPVRSKKFACEVCKKTFKFFNFLAKHMIKVHSEQSEESEDDGYAPSEATTISTSAEPSGVKNLACEVCGKRFKDSSLLGEHAKLHLEQSEALSDEAEDAPSEAKTVVTSTEPSNAKNFACDMCGKRFKDSNLLEKHEKVHSEQCETLCDDSEDAPNEVKTVPKPAESCSTKKFACDICGKRFKYSSLLEKHAKVHSEQCEALSDDPEEAPSEAKTIVTPAEPSSAKKFACDICGKRFKYSSLLAKHAKLHSEQNESLPSEASEAKIDDKDMKGESSLHVNKVSQCDVCGWRFQQCEQLAEHVKMHAEDTSSITDDVTLSSEVRDECLDTKSVKHVDTGDVKCSVCGKRFSDAEKLAEHSKTHSDSSAASENTSLISMEKALIAEKSRTEDVDKVSKCDICGKRFQQADKFTEHMKMHSEVESCVDNAYATSAEGGSKVMVPQLLKKGPSKCEVCGKRCPDSDALTEHLKLHTDPNSAESSIPGSMEEASKVAASQSENSEASKCRVCGKRFLDAVKFAKHIKMHADLDSGAHDAIEVSKDDDKNQDIPDAAAKNKEAAKCNICGKRFSQVEKLNVHMKVHSDLDSSIDSMSTVSSAVHGSGGKQCSKCSICGRRFQVASKLAEHLKMHSDLDSSADNVSRTSTEDAQVQKSHSESKTTKCGICGKRFQDSDKLTEHLKMHSDTDTTADNSSMVLEEETSKKSQAIKPQVLKCTICGKRFHESDKFDEHLKMHSDLDSAPNNISTVSEKGSSKAEWSISARRQASKCSVCGKRFQDADKLEEHLMMHSDFDATADSSSIISRDESSESRKPASRTNKTQATKCKICGKRFQDSEKFSQHLKMHSDLDSSLDAPSEISVTVSRKSESDREESSKCNVCGKRFESSSKLTEHMKIHSDVKESTDRSTDDASKTSKEKTSSDHKSGHQHDKETLKCFICGKKFHHPKKLSRHLKNHSKKADDRDNHKVSSDQKHSQVDKSDDESIKDTKDASKTDATSQSTESTPPSLSDAHQSDENIPRNEDKEETEDQTSAKPEVKELPKCGICGKKFDQNRTLKKHLKIHNLLVETLSQGEKKVKKQAKSGTGTSMENGTSYLDEFEKEEDAKKAKKEFVTSYKIPRRPQGKEKPINKLQKIFIDKLNDAPRDSSVTRKSRWDRIETSSENSITQMAQKIPWSRNDTPRDNSITQRVPWSLNEASKDNSIIQKAPWNRNEASKDISVTQKSHWNQNETSRDNSFTPKVPWNRNEMPRDSSVTPQNPWNRRQDEEFLKCRVCGWQFEHKAKLMDHVKLKHAKPVEESADSEENRERMKFNADIRLLQKLIRAYIKCKKSLPKEDDKKMKKDDSVKKDETAKTDEIVKKDETVKK